MRRETVEYNGVRYYRYPDAKQFSDRQYFKRQGKLLHRVMWQDVFGPIPDGFDVHHKDRDPGHNEPANFELLSRADHGFEHRGECSAAKRAHLDRIRPLASAWHGSDEGIAWHREHGAKSWHDRAPIDRGCEHCGKPYSTLGRAGTERFCSNACKSDWRRKSGADNIMVICPVCGHEFTKNRYARAKTCSRVCGQAARRQLRE